MAAKASVTKQCVYCLRLVPPSDVTDDHVIARSWYPNDTPPIGKWKAPACSSCNNRYSAPEKDILGRMAFCMDPAEPALGDIVQQARRAIDPRQAKSARDAIHRSNRREKLRQSVISVHNPDAPGILPSFRSNFSSGSRTGILIPARPLNAVIEKWIRGIHYCEFGKPIPTDYDVSIQLVSDENAEEIFARIQLASA